MSRKWVWKMLLASVGSMLTVYHASAGGGGCLPIVAESANRAFTTCQNSAAGEACIGSGSTVSAKEQVAGNTIPDFNAPGDTLAMADDQQYVVKEFDTERKNAAFAILKFENDLQGVVFGDTELTIESLADNTFDVYNWALSAGCTPFGVIWHTPSSAALTTITVNGIEIQFSGAIYTFAYHDDWVRVGVLEGQAQVGDQIILPGTYLQDDADTLRYEGSLPDYNAVLRSVVYGIEYSTAQTRDLMEELYPHYMLTIGGGLYYDTHNSLLNNSCANGGVALSQQVNANSGGVGIPDWYARPGTTVTFTLYDDPALPEDALTYISLSSVKDTVEILGDSGDENTLTYTFAEETRFMVNILSDHEGRFFLTAECVQE